MRDELASYDAIGLATLIAEKQVSANEVLEATIERIEALNPVVNAVVRTMYDEAHAQIADGLPVSSPLAGVPFMLKDFGADYAGVPTTNGSRFFASNVPTLDSDLVTRHKLAGLVICAKTNVPELASNVSTEPVLFGPTRNPWNLDRIAGGSSGGAAAAVAAGMLPLVHATDGGGSIRIPASCCGLFGLKPSRGRNPTGPTYANALLGVEHGLSKTVRDSAALLDATSGALSGDPYSVTPPGQTFLQAAGQDPQPLRIAFSAIAPTGAPVDPECVTALEDAMALAEALGHTVEEAPLRYDGDALGAAVRLIIGASALAAVRDRASVLGRSPGPDDLELVIQDRIQLGDAFTATEYHAAIQAIAQAGRQVGTFFEEFDVFATPTVAKPPPVLGTFDTNTPDVQRWLDELWGFIPFTAIFNSTGLPAMSVPLGRSADNLPVGVQFGTRFGGEELLFSLAGQLERAKPWTYRLDDQLL